LLLRTAQLVVVLLLLLFVLLLLPDLRRAAQRHLLAAPHPEVCGRRVWRLQLSRGTTSAAVLLLLL
jgi:hypothetical protein